MRVVAALVVIGLLALSAPVVVPPAMRWIVRLLTI